MSAQLVPPDTAAQALAELRELIASTGHAATFSSVDEYRAALPGIATDYARLFPPHAAG